MKTKRIISILLVSLMLFTTMQPFSVFAEAENAVITVEAVSAAPGATVDVVVSIENNPGILGASVTLEYDSGLTLLAATSGEAFSLLTFSKPGQFTSPCIFGWDGQELSKEDVMDGTILTLQFKVNDNAESGDEYDVKLSYEYGDIVDFENLQPITVDMVNGVVSIVDYMPGDLNDDEKVNMTDVILLRRHIVGGYNVAINESAADVNNDQRKNMTDAILMRRYIVGGYDVELLPSRPSCSHIMEATAYKAPSCTEDGNIAYWHCTVCNKYYSDANGSSATTLSDTVITKTGHTVVIDPAVEPTYDNTGLTEGKHCSVCNEVIVAQSIVPKLEKNEYTITYHIYNNDSYLESIAIENPNPSTYAKEDGLVLQDLMVSGYNFVGWFTAQTGGTQVTEIAVGTTGNKTLYAHWEKVTYTVQFASDMVPVNDLTYTAGEERTLPKPVLDRYTFVGWSDKDGQMWDTIPVGTAKNIVLYANWSSNRNKAVAVKNLSDPIICEDSENGLMLFTYEIGEIKNVPLYEIMRLNCVNGIISSISTTTSQEVSSTQAKTIAQTISNATTNSASWTLENSWNNSTEVSQTYLDQTGQTREEAESLAKNESGTYNLTSGNGGSKGTTDTSNGSFKLSGNKSHSDTNTTEKGQDFGLSVDGKFSSETSIGASIPLEVVNLDVGAKYGFEIGAGADYGNYVKNTNTGTDGWSNGVDISNEVSKTTIDEKNWNTTEGYSNSKSTSTNSSVANAVSKLISEEYGYGSSYAEGGSNSNSQALASTDTKSDEYSATMTYHTSKIESTTKSIETTGNTIGDYRYVMAGTVHVFAVIGYDVAEKTYFVYTYNVMDDTTYEYVDYSFDGTFNDYETSIIPFEIPHFVNDYVNTRTAKTAGLQIDPDTGMIVNYIPDSNNPDTIVIIPSYMSIDNGDGTFSSVKVTGIADGLFKNNTNLVGVKLGNFITEIPDSAFEGCSSLKYVVTPGVTKIGNNAFSGCTSLSAFTLPIDVTELGENGFAGVPNVKAVASNTAVAQSVAASGAENVVLDISSASDISGTALEIGESASFELQGKDKEYSGISVKSDAETTIINGVKFTDCADIPMEFASENVTLNRVTANTSGFALVMSADDANVKLNQTVTLTSSLGNTVLCKNVNFASLSSSVVGKMTLSGDMLVAGAVAGQSYLTFNSGEIKYIQEEEFESYRSSVNVTFDANGGSVEMTSKSVAFNTAIGELPMATYGDYTLIGWYTDEGLPITAETVITSEITAYAKWNNWDGTSSEPAYDASAKTYTITNGNELAWVSDVTNGIITSGTNFPDNRAFAGYTIEFANDIYLNDTTGWESWSYDNAPKNVWKTIGYKLVVSGSIAGNHAAFHGNINGNSCSIYGLYCLDQGFLYEVGSDSINSVVENLHFRNGFSNNGCIYKNFGIVRNCSNNMNVVTDTCTVGGIVNNNISGLIENCYNTGNVRHIDMSTDDSVYSGLHGVGGICGENSTGGIIRNCYNTGDISAYDDVTDWIGVGGVVGALNRGNSSSPIVINNCYSIGNIETNRRGPYGITYAKEADYVIISNCYCNSAYTPIGYQDNVDYIEATNVKGLSIASFKSLSNLTGFSSSIWATDPNINDGYPYLIALKDTY